MVEERPGEGGTQASSRYTRRFRLSLSGASGEEEKRRDKTRWSVVVPSSFLLLLCMGEEGGALALARRGRGVRCKRGGGENLFTDAHGPPAGYTTVVGFFHAKDISLAIPMQLSVLLYYISNSITSFLLSHGPSLAGMDPLAPQSCLEEEGERGVLANGHVLFLLPHQYQRHLTPKLPSGGHHRKLPHAVRTRRMSTARTADYCMYYILRTFFFKM